MKKTLFKALFFSFLVILTGVLTSSCGPSPTEALAPSDTLQTLMQPTEVPPTVVIDIQPSTDATQPSIDIEPPPPTSLNPTGPYIYFRSEDRIWISNPDGTFLKLIAEDVADRIYINEISPDGKALLAITKVGDEISLMEYSIPDGKATKIDLLLTYTESDAMQSAGDKTLAFMALRNYPIVAWQPGTGRYIAYSAVKDNLTTDLFLYDHETGESAQLFSGASHTIMPSWSPDGQYILHYGVNWSQPFGGAIGPYNDFHGAFATHLTDGATIAQPEAERVNFVGWLDSGEYITFDKDLGVTDGCSAGVFKAVNPANRETRLLTDQCFSGRASFSPTWGTILVTNETDCSCSPGEGLYLLSPQEFNSTYLMEGFFYEIDWMPENDGFWPYPGPVISGDGSTIYTPPPVRDAFEASISKMGYQAWKIYDNQEATVVVKAAGGDWETIMTEKADNLIWDPISGETLLITSTDGKLYRAKAPEFALEQVSEFGHSIIETGWILP